MKKWILFVVLIPLNSYAINEKELECLAKNVYFESRHLSLTSQAAVMFVVKNRVKHRQYPSTICGVVWQPKQFSWTHDGKSTTPYEKQVYSLIKVVSKEVWSNLDKLEDITFGATHYYAPKLMKSEPCWLADMKFLIQIEEHRFYKKVRSTGGCMKKWVNPERAK